MKIQFVKIFICLTITFFLFESEKALSYTTPQIENPKIDTTSVNDLVDQTKAYFNSDPNKAINLAKQSRQMAQKIKYPKGEAYSLKNLGIAYYILGNYESTLISWQSSLKIFESIHDELGVANLLSNIGSVYFNQANMIKALEYNLKSLRVAEKIKDDLRIATALVNIGAIYYNKPATHTKALNYYLKALPIFEKLKDDDALGTVNTNIGEIYFENGKDSLALIYFKKSLIAYKDSENMPYALNSIGKVYAKGGDFEEAISSHARALGLAEKLSNKMDITQSLIGLANSTLSIGDERQAITFYKKAEVLAKELKSLTDLKEIYGGQAIANSALQNYQEAFNYQAKLSGIKDSLYNIESDKRIAGLQFDFDIKQKQGEIDLLLKNRRLQQLELDKQRSVKNSLIGGILFVFIIAFILFRNYRIKAKTNKILDQQKAEIERLVSNILPAEVASELQKNGVATPRYYESVTVMFTDFKNFTNMADDLSPQEVVSELNICFMAFDEIIGRHNLEKIKTIGDAYMCAGGIPTSNKTHAIDIIKASIEIKEFINQRNLDHKNTKRLNWELRIGINSGPVVAGVVGQKKYAYDIWGSTVNTASRMESNGKPGMVNISAATYELIKHKYECTYRGKIMAKNVGEIDMYFVDKEIVKQHDTEEITLNI